MIERVARALCLRSMIKTAAGYDETAGQTRWTLERPVERQRYIDASWNGHAEDARAAIEAMREPTEAMMKASGATEDRDFHVNDVYGAWQDMIDAALAGSRIPPDASDKGPGMHENGELP